MYAANHWGGSFEIADGAAEDDHSRNMDLDRGALSRQQHHELDETQQSWLLGPPEAKKKDKYVDLGCVVVKRKLLWWAFWCVVGAFVLIGLPIIIAKSIPHKKHGPPPPDQYTEALHKALRFFNAQKCECRCYSRRSSSALSCDGSLKKRRRKKLNFGYSASATDASSPNLLLP